jgi:hypothetical protein
MNKTRECKETVAEPQRVEETPETIYIMADEAHVSMQDGKNGQVPLIVICSGKEKVNEGRNRLTDRYVINGYGLSADKRWEYTRAVCNKLFDMDKVKNVMIFGDGAAWINKCTEEFPNAVRVLDAYHYAKYIRALTPGEIGRRHRSAIVECVRTNDINGFRSEIENVLDEYEKSDLPIEFKENAQKQISEKSAYILSNWIQIQNIKHKDSIGSCTEAMVSHIFAERMSMKPMAWSKAGLEKISMVKTLIENGGLITAEDIEAKPCKCAGIVEKFEELIKAQQSAYLAGAHNWGIFEPVRNNVLSPSGIKTVIRSLGKLRRVS